MLFSEFPGALRTGKGFVGGEIACTNTWSPGPHTGCQYRKRKVLLALGTKCLFATAEQWVSSVCYKPGQKLLSRCIAVSPNSCACSRKESPGSELASAFHCGDDFTSWQLRAPFWASVFYNHQFLASTYFAGSTRGENNLYNMRQIQWWNDRIVTVLCHLWHQNEKDSFSMYIRLLPAFLLYESEDITNLCSYHVLAYLFSASVWMIVAFSVWRN